MAPSSLFPHSPGVLDGVGGWRGRQGHQFTVQETQKSEWPSYRANEPLLSPAAASSCVGQRSYHRWPAALCFDSIEHF